MMIAFLLFAALTVAVFRSELMWELMTGLALIVFVVACLRLEGGVAVTAAVLLGGCIWHWSVA
jgi:hypothetical protein